MSSGFPVSRQLRKPELTLNSSKRIGRFSPQFLTGATRGYSSNPPDYWHIWHIAHLTFPAALFKLYA